MQLPPDLLRRPPEEIVHRIALGFLDETRVACERLRDPDDADALHDFRVALRRLRSTLGTWRKTLARRVGKRHRRMLKQVQRATGGGRDAEVGLAWLVALGERVPADARAGHAWLCERMQARLEDALASVRADVRHAFARAEKVLRRRLGTALVEVDLQHEREPEAGGLRFAWALRGLDETLRERLAAVRGIEDEAAAHSARIACKRLRYHVEPLRSLLPEAKEVVRGCKALQTVLGDMNDAAVLRRWVRQVRDDAPAGAGAGIEFVLGEAARRHHELHARFAEGWLAPEERSLHAHVDALATTIEAAAAPAIEIERTFLLRGPPTLPEGAETREIEQGYLPVHGYEDRVRRLRTSEGTRCVRTIKLGQGLRRHEVEHELDEPTFEALWPLTEGRRLRKRRHVVPVGGRIWEVDEFLDRDLWLAEVELASTAEAVDPPAWLASVVDREVTDAPAYGNRQLAR